MGFRKNLTGMTFGDLEVLAYSHSNKWGKSSWNVRCICGKEFACLANSLTQGRQVSCGCRKRRRGADSPQWKGGHRINSYGYVELYSRDHPNCTGRKVLEHHVVMSEILGRPIDTKNGESVHHKNGIRHDNRPENLELWTSFQPSGQRVTDLVAYCEAFLRKYAPNKLVEEKDDRD